MSSTVSEAFSFKPEFDIRKPSIGIIQSESYVSIDDPQYKKEKEQECMRKRTKAGIRFKCPTM